MAAAPAPSSIAYAKVRHVVVSLGVRLELSPADAKGQPTVSELLSPADARRLAWGILADLDPEKATAVRASESGADSERPRPVVAKEREPIARQNKRIGRPPGLTGRRRGEIGLETQGGRLLAALRDGERKAGELEVLSGVPTGVIGARMVELRRRALAVRIDGGSRSTPATYALTDAGWAALDRMKAKS